MPFKSESQRRFLWLKHPSVARRWAHEYPNQGRLPDHVKSKKKHRKKKAEAPALFARLGLVAEEALVDDLTEAALYAIKAALWPNQQMPQLEAGSLNPGAPTPNPMANTQAAQAQPLMPPDQTSQQAPQQAPQQSGHGSVLFNVPHPEGDAARWQQMVQAPFQNLQQPVQDATPTKAARMELRSALQDGRNGWFYKIAQALATRRRLPSTLVKLADGEGQGGQYQNGWMLPSSFVNNPMRYGGAPPQPFQPGSQPGFNRGVYGVQQRQQPGPAAQFQAQEQFLHNALATGRVNPRRYEQLMQQLRQRRTTLDKYTASQSPTQPSTRPEAPVGNPFAEQDWRQATDTNNQMQKELEQGNQYQADSRRMMEESYNQARRLPTTNAMGDPALASLAKDPIYQGLLQSKLPADQERANTIANGMRDKYMRENGESFLQKNPEYQALQGSDPARAQAVLDHVKMYSGQGAQPGGWVARQQYLQQGIGNYRNQYPVAEGKGAPQDWQSRAAEPKPGLVGDVTSQGKGATPAAAAGEAKPVQTQPQQQPRPVQRPIMARYVDNLRISPTTPSPRKAPTQTAAPSVPATQTTQAPKPSPTPKPPGGVPGGGSKATT